MASDNQHGKRDLYWISKRGPDCIMTYVKGVPVGGNYRLVREVLPGEVTITQRELAEAYERVRDRDQVALVGLHELAAELWPAGQSETAEDET